MTALVRHEDCEPSSVAEGAVFAVVRELMLRNGFDFYCWDELTIQDFFESATVAVERFFKSST